jgi:DNA polymerase-3 subunit alpha
MPEKYKTLDIGAYVVSELMSKTGIFEAYEMQAKPEWDRVCKELKAFEERGMNDLLRYMVYLVDFMRENEIVWGVGRGSSVASYVLYLIGVHKIDSVKYQLDWQEFLK